MPCTCKCSSVFSTSSAPSFFVHSTSGFSPVMFSWLAGTNVALLAGVAVVPFADTDGFSVVNAGPSLLAPSNVPVVVDSLPNVGVLDSLPNVGVLDSPPNPTVVASDPPLTGTPKSTVVASVNDGVVESAPCWPKPSVVDPSPNDDDGVVL